jgi:recombination protein RecT
MSTTSEMKQVVAQVPTSFPLEEMIKKSVKTLGEALPSHMNSERLVRIALTTLRMNKELYKCTPESFMGALFQSAQLGLEPNIEGQAYILPFNNKRKKADGSWHTIKEASFQIGYKGYVDLFFRHQNSISLDMQKVHENDNFDYSYGTGSFLRHKPALKDRGAVIGYYAVAKMAHNAHVFKFMSLDECMEHGKSHSKCYNKTEGTFYPNTPWATNPDAMCLKTVLIQLMKLLPKSIEIQKALAMDETIKTRISPDMFESADEAVWEQEEEVKASPSPEPNQKEK